MTALTNNRTNFLTVLITAALILLTCNSVLAQKEAFQNSCQEVKTKMINNLSAGIKSNNEGLRRSSIYYAGYYGIEELTDVLVDKLFHGENSTIKILAAVSLYRIGNNEGFNAVKKLAAAESDAEVRKMGEAILNQYNIDAGLNVAAAKE